VPVRTRDSDNKFSHLSGGCLPRLTLADQVLFPGAVLTISVVRNASKDAVALAQQQEKLLLVIADDSEAQFEVGTLAEVQYATSMPDGSLRVILKGLQRTDGEGQPLAQLNVESSVESRTARQIKVATEAKRRSLIDAFIQVTADSTSGEEVVSTSWGSGLATDSVETLTSIQTLGDMCDQISHLLPLKFSDKKYLLKTLDVDARYELLNSLLHEEIQVVQFKTEIRKNFESGLEQSRREIYLKEQIRLLQNQLATESSEQSEVDQFEEAIRTSGMSDSAKKVALNELKKLDSGSHGLHSGSQEEQVVRNYLQTLLDIPWGKVCEESHDIAAAESELSRRHFGQEVVKERILEFLSIRKLHGSKTGDILCFLGPPGVGKTSMATAIAAAIGRPVEHIALGGVRDDAEIRGHRRTYVGARPGRLVQAIRHAAAMNPVIVLDEIDKMGSTSEGDPMSGLLEVLDSSQNHQFVDHFLEVPVDLSGVLFIASANSLEDMPLPLIDRMEIIEFPGYSEDERREIAKRHMLPKIAQESGLKDTFPSLSSESLVALCRGYTRETGVRSLNRELQRLGRKLARRWLQQGEIPSEVGITELISLLGEPPYLDSPVNIDGEVGTAHGLVVSGVGGDRMVVEVSLHRPIGNEPKLKLTGGAGKVMQESVEAALTCVRAVLDQKGIDSRFDVHVHLPQAAIQKDGPSAGLTVAIALFSAFTGRLIRRDVAMTGEITLRGHVLPVGGLREKLLAAARFGYKTVLYPASQEKEVSTLLNSTLQAINAVPIAHFSDSLEYSLQTGDQSTGELRHIMKDGQAQTVSIR
jgi:ATP-dependent Lon protease